MAVFSTLSMSEARTAVLPPRKATQEQYRAYVRQLSSDQAGQLQLGEGDRPITERARLKAAAKAEGIDLEIRRRGNTMIFWQSEEAPRSGGNGRRRGGRGR